MPLNLSLCWATTEVFIDISFNQSVPSSCQSVESYPAKVLRYFWPAIWIISGCPVQNEHAGRHPDKPGRIHQCPAVTHESRRLRGDPYD